MQEITRKTFIRMGTAATLMGASGLTPCAWGGPSAPSVRLSEFGYGDVELLAGPMRRQFDENHAFFMKLDDDRLLKPFRLRAGQPAPGEDMGGWYTDSPGFDPKSDFRGFIPGHSFGQYLSGLARAFFYAGARAVVASLWPVEDEATGQLMQRFNQHLATGENAARSLRAAQLELMAAGYAPYQWAAFVTIGLS